MMSRRAYSLIEVLIATTVLGLGVLGLIAILAGSAVQQQTASLQNISVGVARNAEGVLTRLLGRPGGNFSSVRQGQWTNVPMDEDTLYLTVHPGYLLVPVTQPVDVFGPLFSNPGQLVAQPPEGLGQGSNFNNVFQTNPLRNLRHRRIEPEAPVLSVTVETWEFDALTNRVSPSDEVTLSFNTLFGPASGDLVNLHAPTGVFGGLAGTMQFDRREANLFGRARIALFNITGLMSGPNPQFINKITVNPYSWRNDQLISLTDRLVVESDDDFPGGKRPFMSYSALIRRTSATTQLCFFTYSCRALSKPIDKESGLFKDLALVPPDGQLDVELEEGVLGEVQVQLGYERDTQRYFVEIDESEQDLKGWAITQGQVLMMSSKKGVVNNPPDSADPGSDFPVRVLSTRNNAQAGTVKIQAFLDRAPRIDGRSPLENLFDASKRQEVSVWAVRPVIKSKTDETEWALTPIEARVIQVADQ